MDGKIDRLLERPFHLKGIKRSRTQTTKAGNMDRRASVGYDAR